MTYTKCIMNEDDKSIMLSNKVYDINESAGS